MAKKNKFYYLYSKDKKINKGIKNFKRQGKVIIKQGYFNKRKKGYEGEVSNYSFLDYIVLGLRKIIFPF